MGIEFENVIPWGRSFEEYSLMFKLQEDDYSKRILGCSDGPASFNKRMSDLGKLVVSCDPIYELSKEQIRQRIHEVKKDVIRQVKDNADNYIWDRIKDPNDLLEYRLNVMNEFLDDYEQGKSEGRYLASALPNLPFENNSFDICLCSYFLFTFESLGLEFHLECIKEMARVAKEVRIFPLVDLNCKKSGLLEEVIGFFVKEGWIAEIVSVDFEFQRNANQMLRIMR